VPEDLHVFTLAAEPTVQKLMHDRTGGRPERRRIYFVVAREARPLCRSPLEVPWLSPPGRIALVQARKEHR